MKKKENTPVKLSIIKEIASEIECGMNCFFNPKTKELISLFGEDLMMQGDEDEYREMFKEQIDKVEKNEDDFIKFEALESRESFKIMEAFKDQLSDKTLQNQLENALVERKPFQNFKRLVDHSNFRQEWFDFRRAEITKIVKKIFLTNGIEIENS